MNAPRSGCPINLTLEAQVRQRPSLPRVADPVGGAFQVAEPIRRSDQRFAPSENATKSRGQAIVKKRQAVNRS